MTTKEILERATLAKAKMLTLTGEEKNNALLHYAKRHLFILKKDGRG